MSSQTIALLAILSASLFWATANVVTRILLHSFDPFPLAFLRFFFASFVILPFFLREKNKNTSQFLKDVLPIALFSTTNIFLFYIGLQKTTANASAIIYTATPLIVAVLSQKLLHESLTKRKITGIILGFVGVLVILIAPLAEKGQKISGDFWGNLIILGAAFSWAFYTLGSRHLINNKKYSPLAVSAISIFITTIVFGLLTQLIPHRNFIIPLFNSTNFLLVIHLAVVVTVATYLLFQWAVKHATAATVSLNNYIQPVFAVALGMIVLGEKLTVGFVVGSVLVFIGVFTATGTQILKQLIQFLKNII